MLAGRSYTLRWSVEKHWGIFARRAINKDEVVTYYGGKYFESTEQPAASTHLLQILKRGAYIDGMYTHNFSVMVMLLTNQVGSLANSSWGDAKGNNCHILISNSHHRVKIVATQNIPAGSEILVPYGPSYAQPQPSQPPPQAPLATTAPPPLLHPSPSPLDSSNKPKTSPAPTTPPSKQISGKRYRELLRAGQF